MMKYDDNRPDILELLSPIIMIYRSIKRLIEHKKDIIHVIIHPYYGSVLRHGVLPMRTNGIRNLLPEGSTRLPNRGLTAVTPRASRLVPSSSDASNHACLYGSVSKPCTPVVHIKIAGKWMFIPLKMVLIGIDPYPSIL